MKENDELRDEYDFAQLQGGMRGKYAKRYRASTDDDSLAQRR